ncbi:DUF2254 domain-containing protein [Streptomyces sp. NPDC058751]|uniref:DUF2254 domain-containing protein n=1 Tax=Streptomyces sp. NPDC058751 TaxID=3346623 RepID=UPI0036BAA38E
MGDWMTAGGLREGRRPRALSPLREHLRDTFWFAPTAAMVLVFVVWAVATEIDTAIVDSLREARDYDTIDDLLRLADDAKAVVTVVSSAMMTFIGVVFSISLVAVQMASGQFTPRVVRIFVRSRITKATFAVFLATFLLSLLVLTSYEGQAEAMYVTSVPLVQSVLTLTMLGLSLLLFVLYVNQTLRLMRISHVIDRITREAFKVVARMPAARSTGEEETLGPETARLAHHGRAGVLRDVNIARLVGAARREGVVLRLIPRIGDFVVPGTPLFAVHEGPAPAGRSLGHTVSVGVDRTFHQDFAFGLRQLADIGLRALSAAVNDPTTAVQAVDRIVQFLAAVAGRPLDTVLHRDRHGTVRLVQPVPGWTELVDLGFAEIRGCAVGTPQVTRRLVAGLDDLAAIAPADRLGPLLRHRALLVEAVERSVPEPSDRAFALHPDRQGIG